MNGFPTIGTDTVPDVMAFVQFGLDCLVWGLVLGTVAAWLGRFKI